MIRANPFCTRFVRPGAIDYRFADHRSQPLQQIGDCVQSSHRSLIIGPHGSGKSTLIHSLLPTLRQRYRHVVQFQLCDGATTVQINGGRRRDGSSKITSWREINRQLVRCDHRDLLVIDGIEQLGALQRLRLAWRAGRTAPWILATSHRPLLAYPVVFETTLDRRRIMELTEQLLKTTEPPVAGLVRNKLANQDWECLTNLRDFWFECYDDVQTFQRQTLTS